MQGNQNQENVQRSNEEIVADLTELLNSLFEPKNLMSNSYLTKRALGITFEIPVRFIYDENHVRSICSDLNLLNKALEQAENVVITKKGDHIENVRPKKDQSKTNIRINDINKEDQEELKKHVYSFVGSPDDIITWVVNTSLNTATVVCKDEQIASQLFQKLSQTPLKDSHLNCSLHFESLYISALEYIQKRKKEYPRTNQPYYYPNYSMQQPYYYPPMNMGYMKNMYENPNTFYQNPNMGAPMNINGGGNMKNGGGYYRGNNRKTFNKRGGGGGGKFYKGKKPYGGRKEDQPSNIEVNDNEFPPLSNEEGNE